MSESDVYSMAKTYKQKLNKWEKTYGELSAEIQSKINKLINEFEKTR